MSQLPTRSKTGLKPLGMFIIALALLVGAAGGQAQAATAAGVHRATSEQRSVLVMPLEAPEAPGPANLDGVQVEVAVEGAFVVYRAHHRGRTHTAYNPVSGTRRWLAYDPTHGRFNEVAPSLQVRMTSFDDLDGLIDRVDALSGKAYPALGWALLRFPAEVNPAEAAGSLMSDPSVKSAELVLRDDIQIPMQTPQLRNPGIALPLSGGSPGAPPGSGMSGGPGIAAAGSPAPAQGTLPDQDYPNDAKDAIAADLLAFFGDTHIVAGEITIEALIYNWGAVKSEATEFVVAVNDQPNWNVSNLWTGNGQVPEIDPKSRVPYDITLTLSDFTPDQDFYMIMRVTETDNEHPGRSYTNRDFKGFSLDRTGRVLVRCQRPISNTGSAGAADPLTDMQWHLNNSGQRAFARNAGIPGEDLDMSGALEAGLTGNGVRIAVVDTGLEICHPDLADNIESDASHNFNQADWNGVSIADPFLPAPVGDHGTSVAGVAAAVADNGIGGRGVAAGASLRGYNYLEANDWQTARLDSLGSSTFSPDSSDVDIFNMSFGGLGREANAGPNAAVFRNGVNNLRGGRGAIYVKAAGNGFNSCGSMPRRVNEMIGCTSANGDPTNNLPYLLVVGGFNAAGKRASYASVGANLWISAPSGEYGSSHPAIITSDQMGRNRGYDTVVPRGLAVDTNANPGGHHISTFNGTSSAAPNAAGAIALLLEAHPMLTWRDVKHILAKTARKIDPQIQQVRYGLGGAAYRLEQPHGDDADRARNWYRFGPAPYVLQLPWVTNAAGYHFHNWYGFGALSVDNALDYAASYTPDSLGDFTESEPFAVNAKADIPDYDSGGLRQTLTVDGLATNANIEAVTLEIGVTHPFTNDLGIHLISPSGTESILNPVFNDALAGNADLAWHLLSNAFYGESPNGEWTLKIVDAASGDAGTLDHWRLRFALGVHPD